MTVLFFALCRDRSMSGLNVHFNIIECNGNISFSLNYLFVLFFPITTWFLYYYFYYWLVRAFWNIMEISFHLNVLHNFCPLYCLVLIFFWVIGLTTQKFLKAVMSAKWQIMNLGGFVPWKYQKQQEIGWTYLIAALEDSQSNQVQWSKTFLKSYRKCHGILGHHCPVPSSA